MDEVQLGYEEIAAEFSDTRSDVWSELAFIRDFVADGMSVADVGCGNGRIRKLFDGKKISYTGIDNSARLLGIAQSLNNTSSTISARFVQGSLLQLPLPDASFDLAICIATLHHVPSFPLQLQAVAELYRIIKPGGRLIMTNWNLAGQLRYWILQVRLRLAHPDWFRGFGLRDFRIPWKLRNGKIINRYYHAFSATELAHLCTKAGFLVEQNGKLANQTTSTNRKNHNIITIAKRR